MLVAPEISPDGQTLVYATFAGRDGTVFVSTGGASPVPLPGGERAWSSGGFSPDGEQVLVTDTESPKMLKRVRLADGQATPIAEGGNVGASWGPDDQVVIGSGRGGLRLVSLSGGEPVVLTSLGDGQQGHWLPRFLPNGRGVLFFIQTGDRGTGQVGLFDFATGTQRVLASGTDPGFAASGHLTFWRGDALWAAGFDAEHLEITGEPAVVRERVGADPFGDAWYSMSREGTLAYIEPDAWVVSEEIVPEVLLVRDWFDVLAPLQPQG